MCRKVRVTVMAVNRLTRTPSARVREKPLTMLAPKVAAEPVQDGAGDQGREVRVPDRRPGAGEAQVDGLTQRAAGAQLLLHALEDEHVGVDGHADGQDEAGDAREASG